MTENDIKKIIDSELGQIKLKEETKEHIRYASIYRKSHQIWKTVTAAILIAVLGGSTVYAGYHMLNRIHVNEEVLPELDPMQIVSIKELDVMPDEHGITRKNYSDYNAIKDDFGVKLLDTDLSLDNPYMLCEIMTDAKDFATITVDYFILGDTSDYQLLESGDRYSYHHGTEYFSPVSLTVDFILSESQMNHGWDRDYLGLYEFVESYTSDQGYTVNILQDAILEEDSEDYISEKVAIFVADGIRYSLKGRVSVETMKDIIDSMK